MRARGEWDSLGYRRGRDQGRGLESGSTFIEYIWF